MSTLTIDITSLTHQISSLQSLLPHLHSTLLSHPSISAALTSATHTPSLSTARAALSKQHAHIQTQTYRLLSGITAFRIQDPDPHAIDNGKVLGLRVELPLGPRYGVPYFVFLARGEEGRLRVMRHTVPGAVPVEGLARSFLAVPNREGKGQGKRGDLLGFGRALRRGVVGFHKRLEAVERLRGDAGISTDMEGVGRSGADSSRRGKGRGGIVSVSSSDAEHVVEIVFSNGDVVRLRMDHAGAIERVAVRGGDGSPDDESRLRKIRMRVMSGDGRIEGVVKRILGGEQG